MDKSRLTFTCSVLGQMGRFGNQLFQIAATIGFASKVEGACLFPTWSPAHAFKHQIPQVPTLPDATFVVSQKTFGFVDLRVEAVGPCVIDLRGYFQSDI